MYWFIFFIAIDKSSQDESGIATVCQQTLCQLKKINLLARQNYTKASHPLTPSAPRETQGSGIRLMR